MSDEPTLQSLREQGLHLHDPLRFHFLEVLSRRLVAQPDAVRQVLLRRLSDAVRDYASRAHASQPSRSHAVSIDPACTSARGSFAPSASALAQLNRELAARTHSDTDTDIDGVPVGESALSEMKSVRQFSEVWSKISAEQQVVQALDRAPENAGPLNAQKLMLRSLSLMRTLSPDYLRRFMSQMETLLWLEAANTRQTPGRTAARPAKPRRAKP